MRTKGGVNGYLYMQGSNKGHGVRRELKPGGVVSLTLRQPDGSALIYDLELTGGGEHPCVCLSLTDPGSSFGSGGGRGAVFVQELAVSSGGYVSRRGVVKSLATGSATTSRTRQDYAAQFKTTDMSLEELRAMERDGQARRSAALREIRTRATVGSKD